MPRKAKISSLTARGQSAAASSRESAVNIRIDHRRGLKSTKRDRHGAPLALAIFAEDKEVAPLIIFIDEIEARLVATSW